MKNVFKHLSMKIWAGVTIVLAILLIVVSVLANTTYASLLNFAMGGPGNVYAKGQEAAYTASYTSKTEVLKHANEINTQLAEEGMVLLKNKNNALPLATPKSPTAAASSPKVTVFGKNSINIAIGGSGSGAASGKSVDIYTSLSEAGYDVNPALKSFYEDTNASGAARASNSSDLDSGDTVILSTAETPQASYTQTVKDSYNNYNDAAIVVFTRIGGEGFDLPRTMKGATGYRNEDDHYLQLDKNETDLLAAVCSASFKHVIVILNSGSPMELSFLEQSSYYAYQDKIDAAIWMGYPGNSGTTALGEILNGSVNPSGRTVDTFAADFKKSPTWVNFGDNLITGNSTKGIQGGDQYSYQGKNTLYYFVDYEEGVYVGYKYYETRGLTDGETWYQNNVIYPFGYGLSYTSFDWNVVKSAPTSFTKDSKIELQVEVTNSGSVAGKDVVELYGSAPYLKGGIEKPSEALVGYAKTSLLKPGEKETVSVTFDPYSLASYDAKDVNKNGFAGYELEKGNYTLAFKKNAHSSVKEMTMALADDAIYDSDPVTGNAVENQFTGNKDPMLNSDTQLSTVLSRSDWEGTWPTAPTDDERKMSDALYAALKDTKTNNPHDYDAEEDYPVTDEANGMKLRDLLTGTDGTFKGKIDFDDPRWEKLLNQMSVKQATSMYDNAAYQINGVDSIGLPYTQAADGPVGWTSFINKDAYKDVCSYCCGVIIAETWNVDLVKSFGEAVGEEGLVGDTSTGMPYTAWYAPATNIHRSPFGGRCFEYYSEDGFLAGKTAASEITGCSSKGVVPFLKHFALNEQETHRSVTGDCSYVTEQAMREIYLKPFEIAVKEGHTHGVMSSFNRIGTRWTGGDYRLLTTILREEWGFNGAVLCDFNTIPDYMNSKQMAYAGGDLNLATLPVTFVDESSTGDVYVLRRALKDVAYAVGNSNAMKGDVVGHTLAPWQILIIGVDCGVGGALLLWGGLEIVLIHHKEKAKDSVVPHGA
jgi:beta-glucosidase